MRVELHLHTSRYSECAIVNPMQVLRCCYETGYDVVCITEHDAVWSEFELNEMREAYPRLLIFPGVELSLGPEGRQHLLVLGTNDPAYLGIEDGQEVIARAQKAGHLTILAHPFRWPGGHDLLDADLLPDAIEHLPPNQQGDSAVLAGVAAQGLGLPAVNSGDVHSLQMVGRTWIDTHEIVESFGDLRRAIIEGAFENGSDANATP